MTRLKLSVILGLAVAATGCPGKPEAKTSAQAGDAKLDAAELAKQAKGMFGVLPAVADNKDNPVTDAKVTLGQKLYFEERLSANKKMSCNTCHQLDKFGVDNEPTSPGHEGKRGARNSPTVFNAAIHASQFWDGREPDVEAQAKGPIINPIEMGMPSAEAVVKLLKGIPGYVELFKKAFPDDKDPVTYDNLGKAIGAFERKLMTKDRFDEFQNGKLDALQPNELAGLKAFMSAGCTACHTGPALGGKSLMKLGLVKPWPTKDEGRFEVTKQDSDKFWFKVPSLRNVTKTGPYMHDGSMADLGEVVKKMALHQSGKELKPEEVKAIVAFLATLEGTPPADLLKKPELP